MNSGSLPFTAPFGPLARACDAFLGTVARHTRNPLGLAAESAKRPLKIALLVPFHGADAIWGPSCQYSSVLAAAELNAGGGILGRPIELLAADAGGDPAGVVERVHELIDIHAPEVLIGVHLSSVRERLSRAFSWRMPYIFTPLYEGGDVDDGTFAIGETPWNQLAGPVDFLIREHEARNWYMIGNDYVWPRKTHAWLSQHLRAAGVAVSGEKYYPLDRDDFEAELDRIEALHPDVLMQSLVGSACLEFNRAFARRGLDRTILRLSGALEENTLMALEPEARHNLYCASSYFSTLDNEANRVFLDRYYAAFGRNAPVQSVLSVSCYEGMKFLAALAERAGGLQMSKLKSTFRQGLWYETAKGVVHVTNGTAVAPSYLAKATETGFAIIARFDL